MRIGLGRLTVHAVRGKYIKAVERMISQEQNYA
jgi:hypothetical protein